MQLNPDTHQHPLISIRNAVKQYGEGSERVVALDDVSLDIQRGELVSLVGASGSGKSTLLNIVGGIDNPTSGSVLLDGHDITRISDREMTQIRRDLAGIIFQFFNLMPTLSVMENVLLPAQLAGRNEKEARQRGEELLESVGMLHRLTHLPHELSGGEMQRTSIARALINKPRILLADEPTGNLDSKNGEAVLELLYNLARIEQVTLLIATHDPAIAARADRVVEMRDGRVAGTKVN